MIFETLELILIILTLSLIVQLSHMISYCRKIDRLPLVEKLLENHKAENYA